MDPTRENSAKFDKLAIRQDSLSSLRVSSRTFQDKRLTVLESVVKELREQRKLSFRQIAQALNRRVRDIYNTYQAAIEKVLSRPELITEAKEVRYIPVSVLRDRRVSPLEAVVAYLKDSEKLTYAAIAKVLNRDQRTIWTVYNRARKKYAKQAKAS